MTDDTNIAAIIEKIEKDQSRMDAMVFMWGVLDRIGKSHMRLREWKLASHTFQISSELTKAWNRESTRIDIKGRRHE